MRSLFFAQFRICWLTLLLLSNEAHTTWTQERTHAEPKEPKVEETVKTSELAQKKKKVRKNKKNRKKKKNRHKEIPTKTKETKAAAPSRFRLSIAGAYPSLAELRASYLLSPSFSLSFIALPPFSLTSKEDVSSSELATESIEELNLTLILGHEAHSFEAAGSYQPGFGASMSYNLTKQFSLDFAGIYRRSKISGNMQIPFYAEARLGGDSIAHINPFSHADADFSVETEEVDLRLSLSWIKELSESVDLRTSFGFWFAAYRRIKPRANVAISSYVVDEVLGHKFADPYIAQAEYKVESGIEDRLVKAAQDHELTVPIYLAVAIGVSI